jgi:probable rRNA maturation factor
MPEAESILLFLRTPRTLARKPLAQFALQLRERVANGQAFYCLLTDDKELRRLNREFLAHDYPSDVLSFPSAKDEPGLGEMAISIGRAREQAEQLGHGLETEIQILMLHGLLHLLGMDHETDRGKMRRSETNWRKKLGLPAGLIERAKA